MAATNLYIISPDADATPFTEEQPDSIYVHITADETKESFMTKLDGKDISQLSYVGLAFKLVDYKQKYAYFEFTAEELQQKLDIQAEYDRKTARHEELTILCSDLQTQMENKEHTQEERHAFISENIYTYLALLSEKNSLRYPRDSIRQIPAAFSSSLQFFSQTFIELLRGLKETASGLTKVDLLVEGIREHEQFATLLQEDSITVTYIVPEEPVIEEPVIENPIDDYEVLEAHTEPIIDMSSRTTEMHSSTFERPSRTIARPSTTIDPTKVLNI